MTAQAAPLPAPGHMGVDYEMRLDFDRLRRYRLSRAQGIAGVQRVRRLPALRLLQHPLHHPDVDRRCARRQDDPLRAAHPRRWPEAVGLRLRRTPPPAALPLARAEGLPRGDAGSARRHRADGRADGVGSPRDQGNAGGRRGRRPAGRRRHRRAPVPVRDAAAGSARGRRPAAHAGRASDQVQRRDHAAQPGRGDGRRRLPGHRRGAEAGDPRERDRRPGQQTALRHGLRAGRGDQRRVGGAVQPRTRTTSPTA